MVVNNEEQEKAIPSGSQPMNNGGQSQPARSQDKGSEDTSQAKGQGETGTSQDTATSNTQSGASEKDESTAQLLETLQQQGAQFAQLAEALQQQRGDAETPETPGEPAPDYDAQMQELQKKLSDGELTTEEFAQQQSQIMEQKLQTSMQQMMQQYQQQQSAEQVLNQYMQQNPDFNDVLKSQEAQSLLQQNPVFDEVAAYEHMKRQTAESQLSELQQQIQTLQQERDEAIKNGAKVTDYVSKDEGAEMRQGVEADNKNLSPEEGMRLAMRRARQGAAS